MSGEGNVGTDGRSGVARLLYLRQTAEEDGEVMGDCTIFLYLFAALFLFAAVILLGSLVVTFTRLFRPRSGE